MKETILTDKAPAPLGPYSQGYKAGGFIFLAGQGPVNPRTGKLQGDTIAEQTRQVLENIKAILQAGGSGMEDVVKVTVILSDVADFKPMNEVYKTFFSEPPPARACFGGQMLLPGMLLEIDAIAYAGQ